MKYEKKYRQTQEIKEIYEVAPCIKCGNKIMKIDEYEDQYGYISTIRCANAKCDNKIKDNTDDVGIIEIWNETNDIDKVVASHNEEIDYLKSEVKRLKALKISRTREDKKLSKSHK